MKWIKPQKIVCHSNARCPRCWPDGDLLVDARFSLGASAFTTLSRQQQDQLMKFYESSYPNAKVVSRAASTNAIDPNFLNSHARTFMHIVVDGHRILPSSSLNNASSSLIQADIGGRCYIGQVMSIISHVQRHISREITLLEIRWLKEKLDVDMRDWVK